MWKRALNLNIEARYLLVVDSKVFLGQLLRIDFEHGTTSLLIRPSEVLISVRLELVERLDVLRLNQHERFKHLRAGSIIRLNQMFTVPSEACRRLDQGFHGKSSKPSLFVQNIAELQI